ncbi:MAG: LysR family transcriptional regulator [Ketobacter sp.]|nr:LysR family transcriptional regulator [Ketobacter sp.]
MEIAELKAFVAVAEAGSFSQAALQLHLTQPAISKRISLLESNLNCQLFDRIGRQTILTEAGRDLMPRANRILQEMEDMRRAMSNLSGEVSGTLKIGTSHHIGLHRLPPVLKSFSRQYPQVTLDIQFIDSEMAFDLVMQGKLELGIVTLPPDDNGSLRNIPVWQDPLAFMVGNDHPLAKKKQIPLQALADYPAILPSMSTFTRRIVEGMFQEHNLRIDVPISTNYLETIKMMASIGLGWTVLPATMLDDDIKPLQVEGVALSRSLGVVYHPGHSLSNAAKAILDLLN